MIARLLTIRNRFVMKKIGLEFLRAMYYNSRNRNEGLPRELLDDVGFINSPTLSITGERHVPDSTFYIHRIYFLRDQLCHVELRPLSGRHVFGIREHCVHAVSGELLLSGRGDQNRVPG
jgi:hypothetical protein